MILDEVERRLSMMDELEKEVMSNLQRAERLRQSILGFAFSGKLVQQNADAESGAWPDLPLAAEAQGIYKNKK
jgi:type I restriction enzyme S subunit